MDASQEPGELLPLSPAVFHILLALANGERHGYGIMQEIAAATLLRCVTIVNGA